MRCINFSDITGRENGTPVRRVRELSGSIDGGSVRQINPEFLHESVLNPALGFGHGAKRHSLPSDPLHKGFPHTCESEADILWSSDSNYDSWHGVGGDAIVLMNNEGDIIVLDVHGLDIGQIDQAVSPFANLLWCSQKSFSGYEKVFDGHGALTMVNHAHGSVFDFDLDRHKLAKNLIFLALMPQKN